MYWYRIGDFRIIGIDGYRLSGSSEWVKMEAFRPEKENEDLSGHGLRLAQKKAGPRQTAEGLREGERCPWSTPRPLRKPFLGLRLLVLPPNGSFLRA